MDFLDPKEKNRKGIRLAIGYSLMAVVAVIATTILVYRAYGFDIDQRGNVVQNALVFFDSVPTGADIFLNGDQQDQQTNVRMSLPEGEYAIELQKEGYLPWSKTVNIVGGSVERFYYPFLIPSQLETNQLSTYETTPSTVMQSPDKRWLLVSRGDSFTRFISHDLNTLDDNDRPETTNVNFPEGLFTNAPGAHKILPVEWADDNQHILVRHSFRGGSEFILLNHEEPGESVNLSNSLSGNFDKISLRDKNHDQYYIYSSASKTLSTTNLSPGNSPEPLLNGVISYKTHGERDLLYTTRNSRDDATRVVLRLGDDEYLLRQIDGRPEILLDLASFDGKWYPAFSVAAEHRSYVYEDPHHYINDNDGAWPAPKMVLKLHSAPEYLSFSQNSSKVMTSSGQEFSVYDIEFENPYRFEVEDKFDNKSKPDWMDGHRLMKVSGGKVLMFEFDGKNKRELVSSKGPNPAVFDQDYERMYTIGSAGQGNKNINAMLQTELRIEEDL